MFYLDVSKLAYLPSHAVFQVHSQWYQVKVSFNDDDNCSNSASGRCSVGTNVGLVSLSSDCDPFRWCLCPYNLHNVTFKVLVFALVYSSAGLWHFFYHFYTSWCSCWTVWLETVDEWCVVWGILKQELDAWWKYDRKGCCVQCIMLLLSLLLLLLLLLKLFASSAGVKLIFNFPNLSISSVPSAGTGSCRFLE